MDPLTADIGTVDLADYFDRFRRRWWAVALGLTLGIAAGYGLTLVQPPRFDSSTSVLVLPTPQAAATTTTGRTSGDINLDTEAQLVRSAQVAREVENILGGTVAASELRRSVAVSVPPNSQVLTIQVTGDTAEGSRAAADAYAEAYLQQRQATVEDATVNAIQVLSRQQEDLRTQLEGLNATAASLPGDSPNLPTLDAQRTIVIAQIGDLTSRITALQSSAGSPGRVITEATAPEQRTSPVLVVNLGAGALAGLLLGLALAFVADKVDHRVRRTQDVRRAAVLPVLAELRMRAGRPLDSVAESGDQFDLLRNAIIRSHRDARVFQVAELEDHPLGAEATAVALAQSLSRASHDVVLVLAQKSEGLTERLGLSRDTGLTELLRQPEHDLHTVQHPLLGPVRVIGPGADPEQLARLLQSSALPPLLERLKRRGLTVVIVSAAPDRSAAAQAVSLVSDVCLLVVEQGATDQRRLPVTTSELRDLGTEPVGAVLVRRDRRRRSRAARMQEDRAHPDNLFPNSLRRAGQSEPYRLDANEPIAEPTINTDVKMHPERRDRERGLAWSPSVAPMEADR